MQQGCLRTVSKSAFLLLQQYHRLYGLKVIGWVKPPGNAYLSFHLDAKVGENTSLELPDMEDDRLVLTCYQDHVAIPAWAADRQPELQDGGQARTDRVRGWLEQHLTLRLLFDRHAAEIAAWRHRYTVEKSERYLLAWQLAGLLSARTHSLIATPYAFFSDYASDYGEQVAAYCQRFTVCHPLYGVIALNGVGISVRGEVHVADAENLDAWALYCAGQQPGEIVEIILECLRAHQKESGKS